MSFEIKGGVEIPEGQYKAQLEKTEIRSGGKFGDGDFRVWHWLVEKDGEIIPFSDSTSVATSPSSKAYARLTALLGSAPKVGEKIEDPTGKTVVLTIGKKENGFPRVDAVSPYMEPQQTLPGTPR